MQSSLAGKVAIVTSVSGDGQVGPAVAKAGVQLAICARKQSNVEARAAFLTSPAQVYSLLLDLVLGERNCHL